MDLAASVIVTAWREPPERLARLIAALAEQDVDGGVELLVAVDPSDRAALGSLRPGGSVLRVVVVENRGGARSCGLNRAARAAAGEIICRLDARSLPAPDHVRRCVARLRAGTGIGVVGGAQRPVAVDHSWAARGIARALANPWLLGAPAYRRRGRSGPVDTVYLGTFRRQELIELGGYDERLDANEDFELAQRYRDAGLLVWLEEGLDVGYEARDSVRQVLRQYVAFGRSKVRYWRVSGRRPNARQVAALTLASSIAAAASLSVTKPRRLVAVALAALGGTVALDQAGDPHEKSIGVRVSSVVTSWAVVVGWIGGVVAEAITSRSRTASEAAGGSGSRR